MPIATRASSTPRTIHHGIDFGSFELGEGGDSLVFFGRIHPDKGTAIAIDVAERAGLRLVIAGIIHDEDYFARLVEPAKSTVIASSTWGPVGPEQRQQVLGEARALLHLIDFDEPFGFSVVEAMACGTPVIAYPRGSMTEIVRPGVNGFLVSTIEQAIDAVAATGEIDRAEVRRSVSEEFGVDRMVDEYVALYHRLLDR